MVGITQRIEFSAGHRILGHAGKCRFLHGHNYHVEVSYACDVLDKLGMVADFSEVKAITKGWIDEHWDHNMILCKDDPLYKLSIFSAQLAPGTSPQEYINAEYQELFAGRQPYVMNGNPTAEVMAMELYRQISNRIVVLPHLMTRGVRVKMVTIQETDNNWAHFTSK